MTLPKKTLLGYLGIVDSRREESSSRDADAARTTCTWLVFWPPSLLRAWDRTTEGRGNRDGCRLRLVSVDGVHHLLLPGHS